MYAVNMPTLTCNALHWPRTNARDAVVQLPCDDFVHPGRRGEFERLRESRDGAHVDGAERELKAFERDQ